jgi:hypothetical protein
MSNHLQDSTPRRLSIFTTATGSIAVPPHSLVDVNAATWPHLSIESRTTTTPSTSSMALCKARVFLERSCAVTCATNSRIGHEPLSDICMASSRVSSETCRSCIVCLSHLKRSKPFELICKAGSTKTSAGLSRDRLRCRTGPIAPVHFSSLRGARLTSSKEGMLV